MAFTCRTFITNFQFIRHITKPVKWSAQKHYSVRILASGFSYSSNPNLCKTLEPNNTNLSLKLSRYYTTQNESSNAPEKPAKKSMYQRLKSMYKDYWYVAVPVHVATSAIWFGGFYYTVRSGVDVLSLLKSLGISDKLLEPLKESSAGYLALTFALYKVASPLRYAVTLGGTTFAINKLTALGWIKPVPSKERLKEMIQEKKENFEDRKQQYQIQMKEKRDHLQCQMKERKNHFMDEIRKYKEEVKHKVKKM